VRFDIQIRLSIISSRRSLSTRPEEELRHFDYSALQFHSFSISKSYFRFAFKCIIFFVDLLSAAAVSSFFSIVCSPSTIHFNLQSKVARQARREIRSASINFNFLLFPCGFFPRSLSISFYLKLKFLNQILFAKLIIIIIDAFTFHSSLCTFFNFHFDFTFILAKSDVCPFLVVRVRQKLKIITIIL
jgi:hypothetical protein